ncbi:hypothetical protein AB0H83_44075 [Dactylosporangium sp. NPDC050688]|uniref:hypothetical protein n=1 Tax=Dactylosporangium sp. NPDC050688 TaxID=3157217 RepID=UPI00341038AA
MATRGVRAWPYRRIQDTTVRAECWTLDPGTEIEQALPESLSDWDYHRDVKLSRHITIDLPAARRDAGLGDEVDLAVSVRWSAVPSHLRGAVAWVPVKTDASAINLEVVLPGERLGGVVRLETMIVLANRGAERTAVAHRPGSSLWDDAVDIRLQGDAPLFPLAVIPFSRSALPEAAGWFLELGADLHASALGSIQLLVNQENPDVVAAVGRAATPNDVDRVVLSALKTDVIRSMIDRALGADDFSFDVEFEEGTLGAVLQGLLRTYLNAYTDDAKLTDLRRMRNNDAPLFATVIQAATSFLERPR